MKALSRVSNYAMVLDRAERYFGKYTAIFLSTEKNKKYMVFDGSKWRHFGDIRYPDYTYHRDEERRARYRKRAMNIPGHWRADPYSPNNLALNLLW